MVNRTPSAITANLVVATNATASRSLADRFADTVNVKDFGAVGNGVSDDTAAIQAAIDYFSSGSGKIKLPAGTYKVTSQLTIAKDRIHIEGDGIWATTILFLPAADATCFKFSKGASVLYQASLRRLTIYSTDSTRAKTALNTSDCSNFLCDEVAVYGTRVINAGRGTTGWGGGTGGSVAIQTNGREQNVFTRLSLTADRPIQISDNPNHNIDIDHYAFRDLILLGGDTYPIVQIASGVNLTNVEFGGFQAWVGGTTGLKWIDTATTEISAGLRLDNIRGESGNDVANSWLFDIQHNYGLQDLTINNVRVEQGRNGIRLRKCVNVAIDTANIPTTALVVLDAVAAAASYVIDWRNLYCQNGATASLSGYVSHGSGGYKSGSTQPLPSSSAPDDTGATPRLRQGATRTSPTTQASVTEPDDTGWHVAATKQRKDG
jgi:hypothetical protein